MKFVSILYLVYFAKASSEGLPKRTLKSIPVVDALIQRLEAEEWADEACYRDTLQILYGVKNDTLWATWVWDSMQPPTGIFYGTGMQFGNYDQCLNAPRSLQDMSTQYCLVEVQAREPKESKEFAAYDSADEYLKTFTLYGRSLNHLGFGACMPAVCSPSSISKFYRHVLQLTHVPNSELITVDPADCQTAVPKQYPGKYYAYLSFLGALLATVILSTVYTQLKDTKENSKIDSVAKSFCVSQNWNSLFKVNSNEIQVLNGMRVFNSILVVGCHQGLFSLSKPSFLTNSVVIDGIFDNQIGKGLTHVDLVVDTFFAISGLLLIRGLIGGRQKNLLVVLIKRYFRLIGPYAATTLYIMCMARYTGSGPMWPRANANEEGVCEKHWWKNFFMLTYDIRTMCYGVAWYVTCDYHLAILTVLLFWVWTRHRQTGIAVFVAVSSGLIAQLAVKAYVDELPLVPFNGVIELSDIREHKIMNAMYIRWYDRAGSYLVGAAMGGLMAAYKPAEHRTVLSKTRSFMIVAASLYVMMMVATMKCWFNGGAVSVAIAIATNRVIWAIAVCCLIAACEYGSVAIVSDFLGSSVFVPVSKLTYGIYLTHFFIIQRNINVARTAFHLDIINEMINMLGTMVISCLAALALYLLIEAPCMNLSNLFLTERNEKSKEKGKNAANGLHQNGIFNEDGYNGNRKLKTS